LGQGWLFRDLWQQEAVRALQQGKDVVVQAPTGSGKTYVFELLYPDLKTQAVFTVPTRAAPAHSHAAPKKTAAVAHTS
jgi:superfamily II DNA or RNA helicase